MNMYAIDTLAFAKRLKVAGVPDAQAEAFAEAQNDVFRDMLESVLVTKDDLRATDGGLRTAIAGVESGLRAEMQEVEGRLRAEMHEIESSLRAEMHEIGGGLRTEMHEIGGGLRTEVHRVEGSLRSEIADVRTQIYRVVGAQTLLLVGAFAAMLRFLT